MNTNVPSLGAAELRPKSGRYPELDNEHWWMLHGSKSNSTIAAMLGCHRRTVEKARLRNGIPALPPGRARGETLTLAPRETVEQALADRIQHERRRRVAPTEDLLIARIRAAHEARSEGDPNAYDDALLGISSAAALIYEHRQRLRAA